MIYDTSIYTNICNIFEITVQLKTCLKYSDFSWAKNNWKRNTSFSIPELATVEFQILNTSLQLKKPFENGLLSISNFTTNKIERTESINRRSAWVDHSREIIFRLNRVKLKAWKVKHPDKSISNRQEIVVCKHNHTTPVIKCLDRLKNKFFSLLFKDINYGKSYE